MNPLFGAIAGCLHPAVSAPASGPVFVQGNVGSMTGSAQSIALKNPPTAGNLLAVSIGLVAGATGTMDVPPGWTPVTNYFNDSIRLITYAKISDGTETGLSFTSVVTSRQGMAIAEFSNAKLGTATTGYFTSTNPSVVGPSDAPVSAAALPLMFVSLYQNPSTITIPSPWAGESQVAALFSPIYMYRSASNAAVSASIVRGGTTIKGTWANIWIEPK